MNCPHCAIPLTVSDRQGIEIDHCGQCRGVWLDRGELDKIIERTMGSWGSGTSDQNNGNRDHGSRQNQNHNHRREQERENPLLEIFDLFGG